MNKPFNILSTPVRNISALTNKQPGIFTKRSVKLNGKAMLNNKLYSAERDLFRIFNKQHRIFNNQQTIFNFLQTATSNRHETTSNRHQTTSNRHQTTSNRHQTTSNRHQTTSNKHKTTSNRHKTTSNRHKTTSNRHETTSNRHETTSNRHETTSNKHKTKQSLKEFFNNLHNKRTLIRKDDKNLQEFINSADEYLHYSNDVMFFICNSHLAVNFIFLTINAEGSVTGLIFVVINRSLKAKYFIQRIEQTKIFDGVIERYCGVPP